MKIEKNMYAYSSWAIISFLIIISRSMKFSYIWGSHAAFFSVGKALMPLTGIFGGAFGSFITLATTLLFSSFSLQLIPSFLVYHIPGFFASLYWAYESYLIRVFIPLLCIALFIMHPVGFYAAPYSFFWVIPAIIYFKAIKHPFFISLGATFAAHAIGSIIWLYGVNSLNAMQWIGLMPIVCLERLVLALMMYSAFTAIMFFQNYSFIPKFIRPLQELPVNKN